MAVERRSYGVQPITPEVVAAQQKIADVFFELGLIPTDDQDLRRDRGAPSHEPPLRTA